MLHRTILKSLFALSLLGLVAPACDGGNDSCDSGGDDGDDGNADDGNADDGNADDGNADDGNADDGNADDGNADDGNADDGNADDGNADDGSSGAGVGEQCQENAECDSGTCIFAGDVDFGICTILCEDFADCPDFWSCEEIGNATGTYCVPS